MSNKTLQDIRGNWSMSRMALAACIVLVALCIPIGAWLVPDGRVGFIQFVIDKSVFLGALAFGSGKAMEELGAAVKAIVDKLRSKGASNE
jgi:hypothetical protein